MKWASTAAENGGKKKTPAVVGFLLWDPGWVQERRPVVDGTTSHTRVVTAVQLYTRHFPIDRSEVPQAA